MNAMRWIPTILVATAVAACSQPSASGQRTGPAVTDAMQSAPPAPVVQTIQVPSGTTITVRLAQALSTVRNRAGDTFDAILDEPVVVGGRVVLPRGTTFTGHVTEARSSGRLKGRAVLSITLDTFDLRQQSYAVRTAVETSVTRAHEKRNLEMIGGGSGIGALIGGLTGGGKGAALGAAVGAAAGTGVAAGTGRKDVELPADTLRRFRLTRPIEVRQ